MDAAIKALSDPTRREILRIVSSSEMPAGVIASRFSMTRPAVSQHLKVLKEAGLVTERREGVRRLYQARPEGLRELLDFLQHFWDDRLLDLKLAVEAEEKGRAGDR
jgi:DNA-binding transcriptional ArsR family regulator